MRETEGRQGAGRPDLYYSRRAGGDIAATLAANPGAAVAYYQELEGIRQVVEETQVSRIVVTRQGKRFRREHQGTQRQAHVKWRSVVVHKSHVAQYVAEYTKKGTRQRGNRAHTLATGGGRPNSWWWWTGRTLWNRGT